jgi:LysM repeat protein
MIGRRSAARWLAPIAIVAVGAAAYGIVKSGSGDRGGSPARSTARPGAERAAEGPAGETTENGAEPARRRYVVRSGDTLSSISLETGVAVARLQQLNPDIDVQALQPGQRLRLRR